MLKEGKMKTFVIAEAGANHDRKFNQALKLIDVAVEAGASAVKFQTYSSETLYAKNTPNFAGYISCHSTYSRAAAEVLTLLTGSQYFPGGIGEYTAKKNEFLVFEEGPTTDIKIQWATYRDASNQCSLSRIWGGIHPPIDDLPGRVIGEKIGIKAFQFGKSFFRLN